MIIPGRGDCRPKQISVLVNCTEYCNQKYQKLQIFFRVLDMKSSLLLMVKKPWKKPSRKIQT